MNVRKTLVFILSMSFVSVCFSMLNRTDTRPEYMKDNVFMDGIFKGVFADTPWPFMSYYKKSNEVKFKLNENQKKEWDEIIAKMDKIVGEVESMRKSDAEKKKAEIKKLRDRKTGLFRKREKAEEKFSGKKVDSKERENEFMNYFQEVEKLVIEAAKSNTDNADLIKKIVDIEINHASKSYDESLEEIKTRARFGKTKENRDLVTEQVKLRIDGRRLERDSMEKIKPLKEEFLGLMQKLYDVYKGGVAKAK